jgi:lipoprotein-anchoring transpeptidase ErfK/SrfK
MHLASHRIAIADIAGRKFWRLALVAAAGTIGTASRADAAYYYFWQMDSQPGFTREPMPHPRRPVVRQPAKKDVTERDTAAKPQAPLVIAVSINRQQVKIYDAHGLFAEAPVSTGMRGHPTPMGVFSVIQKHKWHHSNIYSGAPMPYMQRITWSGVALHAGVLPGYPASHGCIRMPEAFAIKMWNWTRMGARVVVTPGEIAPESFSHPLLPVLKVQPQPPASAEAADQAPLAAKADKGAPDKKLESAQDKLDLRPAVGQSDTVSPSTEDSAAPREKTRTADAGRDALAAKEPMTISDVSLPKDNVTIDLASTAPAAKSEPGTADVADARAPRRDDAVAGAEKSSEAKPGDNAAAADAAKDQTRLPDAAKAAAAKTEAAKRAGQISALISRKDSKLYVRQNFSPLFDAPVTIAASDRPLGTHIFTAEVDKSDPNVLHWSVVSLPTSARGLTHEDDQRALMRRKGAHAASIEAKPLPVADSPAEALDRITIPAEVMARITEALTTGGSIIVTDQGIDQGETGEDTDFIVSLR